MIGKKLGKYFWVFSGKLPKPAHKEFLIDIYKLTVSVVLIVAYLSRNDYFEHIPTYITEQIKMATREFFVSQITKVGYKPNDLKYVYFVKQQMFKKFKINESTVSKQDYEKIEKEASSFAYKVKAMYVNEFKHNYE